MQQRTFRIIPILGRKTDVPADDMGLFQFAGENLALTHDVGGLNFDLSRKRNACTKSYGYNQYSNSATGQANKCLGLFELYDGINRNYIYCDGGKIYVFDGSYDPVDVGPSGITLANRNTDLYCLGKVGSYVVVCDKGEHTPYAWKNGDTYAKKLISDYTEFKFRYIVYFVNRIIGLYDESGTTTHGDIEVRWSNLLPTPTSNCYFESGSRNDDYQIYIPDDSPIVGGAKIGNDRCYVYSEDSIHQLVYVKDYTTPFRLHTIVANQGAVNHQSIVAAGNRHFFFNKNYGFCEYRGGREIIPISKDIESDIEDFDSSYYDLIVGTYEHLKNRIIWTVPAEGNNTPNSLYFYYLDRQQWHKEDKSMRFVSYWNHLGDYTWNDLESDFGPSATWNDLDDDSGNDATWEYFDEGDNLLVYGNVDGYLYTHETEALNSAALDGYRVEPILDFGDKHRYDLLQEIWFDLVNVGSFSLHIYHRSGDTTGELESQGWTALDTLSCDSPSKPVIYCNENARLHQVKWRTDAADEKFQINGITFRFIPGGRE